MISKTLRAAKERMLEAPIAEGHLIRCLIDHSRHYDIFRKSLGIFLICNDSTICFACCITPVLSPRLLVVGGSGVRTGVDDGCGGGTDAPGRTLPVMMMLIEHTAAEQALMMVMVELGWQKASDEITTVAFVPFARCTILMTEDEFAADILMLLARSVVLMTDGEIAIGTLILLARGYCDRSSYDSCSKCNTSN